MTTTELPTTTTEAPPTTTCPAPVCSGLRCSYETGENGCEVCKCRYKCPKPKCVGNCYPETNAPEHRCPGCVCPSRRKREYARGLALAWSLGHSSRCQFSICTKIVLLDIFCKEDQWYLSEIGEMQDCSFLVFMHDITKKERHCPSLRGKPGKWEGTK